MEQKPTFESVWALLQENAQQMKENERLREKSSAEFDRSLKEFRAEFERSLKESRAELDRSLKESRAEHERSLKESRAEHERSLKESRAELDRSLKESRAELDRSLKESRAEREQSLKESRAEHEQYLKESSEKFDRSIDKMSAEFEKEMKASQKRIKNIEELTGSWTNNHGSFAEEYFFTAFENGKQNFFGDKFDDIQKNVSNYWQGLKDEYDIVLYNHTSVALIEVKYKAHKNDIPNVLRKAETYRILFPNYKDFKIYLGLASLSFYDDLEQECMKQGIAIIKQVGETVVINDAHLKVF